MIEALTIVGVHVEEMPGRIHSTTAALQEIFETAGIFQVTTRAIEIEVSYANFNDYWTSQTGLPNPAVQAIRKLSTADVEKLRSHLREALPRRNGRIAYPARANAVKGVTP